MTNPHESPVSKKKWTFLRKFRWAVYLVFIAGMAFVVVCTAVGIIANIHWRHPSLDIPVDRPESASELGSLQLRDCLVALEKMHDELRSQLQAALSGGGDRDRVLRQWKAWSRRWRRDFEKLGVSCMLTETPGDGRSVLVVLAEIYRLLDYFQRLDTRLVRRYVTENAQPLSELTMFFDKAKQLIEELESQPTESSL